MKIPTPAKAFSLVELLTVVAVVVTLIALLFPAMQGMREGSHSARCLSNLKQIGTAAAAFSNDSEGRSVPGNAWRLLGSGEYLATNSPVWICPADTRKSKVSSSQGPLSYAYNANLITFPPNNAHFGESPVRMHAVNSPSRTVYYSDAKEYYMGTPYWKNWEFRHKGKINALFFDYHVETLSFTNTNDFDKLLLPK